MTTAEHEYEDDPLVAALASGLSYTEAAEELGRGYSRATIARRMRVTAFREAVESARRERREEQRGRILGRLEAALDRVAELRGSANESIALKAAMFEIERADREAAAPVAEVVRELAGAVEELKADVARDRRLRSVR